MGQLPFRVIDLTHTLTPEIPTWTGSCGYHLEVKKDYVPNESPSFKVNQLKIHGGIGTHIDAPSHCCPDGRSVGELNIEELIRPLYVIDVSAEAKTNENFILQASHLESFEATHGRIAESSVVCVHTGWSAHWCTPEKYINNHIFPSIHGDVAQTLIEREVAGIGIDTLSPDIPGSGFPVHDHFLGTDRWILENLANLDKLPATGAYIFALPIAAHGSTEAPTRAIALLL